MDIWGKAMKILSMSGFVPEQICDTVRFDQYTGDRNISHYCGYASDFISQVLADDSIDGAVYPKSCDSTRIISTYLQDSGKFMYQINVPSYNNDGAEEFYASSIKHYKETLEKYYGVSIDDIIDRTKKINGRNAAIQDSYENIANISYTDYLSRIHDILKMPLDRQIWDGNFAVRRATEKTVFIVGSFLSNIKIVEKMEEVGMTVVGDSLTESGRLVSTPPVDVSGDIYKGIAHSILSARLSPTQNCFEKIVENDIIEISKKKAKGVIFIIQKYCEPYEYLFSIYKSKLKELGVRILKLSLNDTEDDRKVMLALEGFSDIL